MGDERRIKPADVAWEALEVALLDLTGQAESVTLYYPPDRHDHDILQGLKEALNDLEVKIGTTRRALRSYLAKADQ